MWDKPHELNHFSSALFAISCVLLLCGVLNHVMRLPVFALRAVHLTAAPQRVDAERIESVVRTELRGNFFTVNLEESRQAFEKLPWVRKVSVRRQFPWRLEVSLEEHEALASWNGVALVNTYGEIFNATTDQILPGFIGQADTAHEVTQMYATFSNQLAPLQQHITQISLSPRHAWQLRLSSGMLLKLGREQAQQRLARFTSVDLPQDGGAVQYVDLRYRNGFAVMYKQPGQV